MFEHRTACGTPTSAVSSSSASSPRASGDTGTAMGTSRAAALGGAAPDGSGELTEAASESKRRSASAQAGEESSTNSSASTLPSPQASAAVEVGVGEPPGATSVGPSGAHAASLVVAMFRNAFDRLHIVSGERVRAPALRPHSHPQWRNPALTRGPAPPPVPWTPHTRHAGRSLPRTTTQWTPRAAAGLAAARTPFPQHLPPPTAARRRPTTSPWPDLALGCTRHSRTRSGRARARTPSRG